MSERIRARRAEALARRRVPLGFLIGALVLWLAQPTASSLAWGTSVALVGEALRIWAAGHLNKASEVTASGPYRWIGHPLYLGSSIMGVGLAVASDRLAATAIIAAYLAVMLTAAARSEEAFLRRTFGDRTSRGGPDVASGNARRFNISRAIANREHRAVAGLVAALLLLLLKATYNGSFGGRGG